jgi:hypothetical protein
MLAIALITGITARELVSVPFFKRLVSPTSSAEAGDNSSPEPPPNAPPPSPVDDDMGNLEPQMSIESTGAIFAGIASLGVAMLASGAPNTPTLTAVSTRALAFVRVQQGMLSLGSLFGLLPVFLTDYMRSFFAQSRTGKCANLATRIQEFNQFAVQRDFSSEDRSIQQEYLDRYDAIASTQKDVIDGKYSREVALALREFLRVHASQYAAIRKELAKATSRKAPVWVHLYGTKGIGKSALTEKLVSEICCVHYPHLLGPDGSYRPSAKYARNGGTSFWDGYHGQPIVTIDDIGFLRRDVVVEEMCRLCSVDRYVLNMASLNDSHIGVKGTEFTSDVIITSSNSFTPNLSDYQTPGAYERRRDLVYKVTCRPEFYDRHNGRVDMSKVTAQDSWQDQLPHLSFQRVAPVVHHSDASGSSVSGVSAIGSKCDYSEFLDVVLTKIKERNDDNRLESFAISSLFRSRNDQPSNATTHDGVLAPQGEQEESQQNSAPTGTSIELRTVYSERYPRRALMCMTEDEVGDLYDSNEEVATPEPSKLKRLLAAVWASLPRWTVMAACALGAIAAFGFAYVTGIFGGADGASETLAQQSREHESLQEAMLRAQRRGHRYVEYDGLYYDVSRAQGQGRENVALADATRVAGRLCGYVRFTLGARSSSGHCIFPNGRWAVIPRHYLQLAIESKAETVSVDMWTPGSISPYKFELTLASVRQFDNQGVHMDMAAFTYPVKFPPCRDSRTLFSAKDETVPLLSTPMLIGVKPDGGKLVVKVVVLPRADRTSGKPRLSSITNMAYDAGYSYNPVTVNGDCGMLLLNSMRMDRPVLGYHVVMDHDLHKGFSNILTRDMVEPMVGDSLPVPDFVSLKTPSLDLIEPQSNATLVGSVPVGWRVNQSPATRYVKSPFFDKVDSIGKHLHEPSVLRKSDPRLFEGVDPKLNSPRKYFANIRPFPDSVAAEACEWLKIELRNLPRKREARLLSESEAIFMPDPSGAGVQGLANLTMRTSPGYPYCLDTKGQGKRTLIHEGKVVHPDLRRRLDNRTSAAKRGERVESVWIDSLKDEKRLLEKIPVGKTRHFTIPPVDYSILCRQYTGAFVAHLISNRHDCFSAVGINPDSTEWQDMYTYLNKWGKHTLAFDGDFSSWDGRVTQQAISVALSVIEDFYKGTEEEQTVRKVLFDEMVFTVQMNQDCLYVTHQGMPSGHPLTAVVNTVVNAFYLRCAYLLCVPPEQANYRFYRENVRDKLFGDDNQVAYSPKVKDFDAIQVSRVLAAHGHMYTPAQKDKEHVRSKPLADLVFLQREYVAWEGALCGAVLPVVINKTVHYISRPPRNTTLDAHVAEILEQVALFLVCRGRDLFDRVRNELNEILVKESLSVSMPTYDHMRALYRQKLFGDLDYSIASFEPQMEEEMTTTSSSGAIPLEAELVEGRVANEGVVLTSTRPVEEAESPVAPMPGVPTVSDNNWNYVESLKRDQFVKTVTWDQDSAAGSLLASFNILTATTIQSPAHRRVLSQFLYFRGRAVFTIMYNGQPFQQGLFKVGFIPMMDKAELTARLTNQDHITPLVAANGTILSAPDNRQVEIPCDFCHYQQYLTYSAEADSETPGGSIASTWGVMYIVALTQLQTGGGNDTSIDLTVTLRFEDVHLAVPRVPLAGQGNVTNKSVEIKYGNIANSTVPVELEGDEIAQKAKATAEVSSMDAASVPLGPLALVRKPIGYLNNAQQITAQERLNLHPSALNLTDRNMIPSVTDEMIYEEWFSRPSYIGSQTWATNDAVAKNLTYWTVCPYRNLISQTSTPHLEFLTPMDTMAAVHRYWTGGFILNMKIAATQFHVGRLLLTMEYGGKTTPDDRALNEAMQSFSAIVDLAENVREYNFHIPFNSEYPWLRRPDMGNNGYVSETTVDGWALGTVRFIVLNQLRAPDTVSSSVQLFLSVLPDDKFALQQLASDVTRPPLPPPSSAAVEPEGLTPQAETGVSKIHPEPILLGRVPSKTPQYQYFGEKYTSIKDLFMKFNFRRMTLTKETELTPGNLYTNSVLASIFKAYRAFRGSQRYKVIFSADAAIPLIRWEPKAGDAGNNAFVVPGADSCKYVECEIPFNSPAGFMVASDNDSADLGTLPKGMKLGETWLTTLDGVFPEGGVKASVFSAFGDDLRLGLFAFPPRAMTW